MTDRNYPEPGVDYDPRIRGAGQRAAGDELYGEPSTDLWPEAAAGWYVPPAPPPTDPAMLPSSRTVIAAPMPLGAEPSAPITVTIAAGSPAPVRRANSW